MQTNCTAQVRVVKTPNAALKQHKNKFSRVYIAFNTQSKPNSKNSVLVSGDIINEDVPTFIVKAVAQLRAKNFEIVA